MATEALSGRLARQSQHLPVVGINDDFLVQYKVRIVAGHKVGISDKYIKRHPEIVKDVCQRIEQAYFSGKG